MSVPARATTDKSSRKLIINSDKSLRQVSGEILRLYNEHKYLVLSIRPGRDRSLEQNKLWRSMYIRIAQVTQMGSDNDAWAYCKLMLGVPILCRDDEGFDRLWSQMFEPLDYEQKLHLMGANRLFGPDGFRVTSLFGTKQGAEYTDRIVDHFAMHGVAFDDILREEQ